MSLNRCTECESIEGKWREPTDKEIVEYGMSTHEAQDNCVCGECGSVLSNQPIPEHDDYEWWPA